ncbi:hypothetical protein BDQ12DRAFT_628198 [Crucibulum laeve]|uniref:CS domain-containing protein n=1 Tax=Crucibulum laeve TaxID=68775 RepID=A0A5C3M6N0_9AGAR|nr:hypothetical protein BDQ12DRAFT_628198 [Crucibulum laeve]
MDRYNERPYYSYSYHQSHDQMTVLLMVPYNTHEEDLSVAFDREYVIAGVRGQPPVVKGRLCSPIDPTTSVWQLEHSRLSARERTTSTTSTTSTHSSFAFISDPDISSSFAASLDSGPVSDAEDSFAPSPALSSPILPSADVNAYPIPRRKANSNIASSRSVSPGHALRSLSSYSSLESLETQSGRLLTLHLEKETPMIWPTLIIGPVPESFSPLVANSVIFDASHDLEHKYNMDPTSLQRIALDLYGRREKEEAFEYFLRAWHQARVPTTTMRLVSHYLPLQSTFDLEVPEEQAPRGTIAYYLQCIGGPRGLAHLYLEAGLLHLEGAASTLLSASYSSLNSIRMPLRSQIGEGGTEAWKRDREAAGRYFERARALQPELDVPTLPQEGEHHIHRIELEMPSMEIDSSAPESADSEPEVPVQIRRRRKKEEVSLVEENRKTAEVEDMDNTWYLYIPGIVGAGTALLVVGIVGALSFSTWSRRNQGS